MRKLLTTILLGGLAYAQAPFPTNGTGTGGGGGGGSSSPSGTPYAVDSGAANAYVVTGVTSGGVAVSSYTDGLQLCFKPANSNTTTSTIAVNGLAAKSIKTPPGLNSTTPGIIRATTPACIIYDATDGYFFDQNPVIISTQQLAAGPGLLIDFTTNPPQIYPDPATFCTVSQTCAWTGYANFAAATQFSMKQGASDPATCAEGDLNFNLTSHGLKQCTSANTWAAIGGGSTFPRQLAFITTSSFVVCDGTTQVLGTYTIPANTLSVGDMLEIKTFMQRGLTGNTASSTVFGVSFGGASSPVYGLAANASPADGFDYDLRYTVTGSSTEVVSGFLTRASNNTVAQIAASTSAGFGADGASAISSNIVVDLTQVCTGPDTGRVVYAQITQNR